ncbi:MAG: hypothetical protein Q8R28_18290 [Dehalococcoidia bacterium]|nr:hypothetical protein [Dehalococcoidia bacterium]
MDLEIIRRHLLGHSAESIEGVAVTGDPGADLLVKDQLSICDAG